MTASRALLSPLASILLLSALSGCAAGGGSPPLPAHADAQPAAPAPGFLDGTYEGTSTPEAGNPECGFEAPIGFDVSGATIRLRTRRQSSALAGAIDATGQFSMTSSDGRQQVVGMIRGARLTATETAPPHHHRHDGGQAVQGGVCIAQIVADKAAADAGPP